MSQRNVRSPTQAAPSFLRPWSDALAARMNGPGGYYNLGNVIGFVVGATQAVLAGGASVDNTGASPLAQLGAYIAGSPSALALSAAMVIFFVSGEVYFKAWRDADRPDLALVRLGDLLSTIAAAVLCVALVLVGSGALGVISTVLLVGGKLGSALMPTASWIVRPPGLPAFDPFRVAVVISRVPALLGIGGALVWSVVAAAIEPGDLVQQITLVVCYSLWLRADLMLFRAR